MIDGSKIVDFGSNGGVMLNMNPDMVEEVKIQTSNYAAEYGSAHVQVTAVTKGGSSQFHGSAYDYVRNWRWNANDRSNNYAGVRQPESSYQYPGFSLSGPLVVPGTGFNKNRDRLFFFVGYEYQHQVVDPGTTLSVVPTLAQRQGDFSELLANQGQNLAQPPFVTIPAGLPGRGRPGPGQRPPPLHRPVGAGASQLYPLPNHSDPDNRYNYAYNTPLPLDRWQLTSRLDWNVSERTTPTFASPWRRRRASGRTASGGEGVRASLPGHRRQRGLVGRGQRDERPEPEPDERGRAEREPLELHNDWEDPARMRLSALGLEGYRGIFPNDDPYAGMALFTWGQGLGDLFGGPGCPSTRTTTASRSATPSARS